jgi:diguanylate cyclase (GGDEF)-like protein
MLELERIAVRTLDENQSRGTPHDTEIIRTSFRKLVRSSVLVSAILVVAHGIVFFSLGAPAWKFSAILILGVAPLYYMTAQQRSFPVFLMDTLTLFAELFVYVTYMGAYLGPESGFHYLILVTIPIVMVAGRIGLRFKWFIVAGVVLFLLALESGVAVPVSEKLFPSQIVVGFHAFNIALVALVLGLGAQNHFIVMSEYQTLLTQQAYLDPLTGLLNRRALLETAEKSVTRARRLGSPFAVVIGDVDLFRQVNDQHGHATGDSVLRQVSALLQEMARGYDSVYRWGGEEFLIVLPDATLDDAAAIAERIRQQFSEKPLAVEKLALHITLTLGVAQLDGFESLEGTIHRADQALYLGKRQGRNQVVRAS